MKMEIHSHPHAGTQRHLILEALTRGETLTVAEALTKYRIYALSQRIGELRREGWPIKSRTVTAPGGSRVSRYYIDNQTPEHDPTSGQLIEQMSERHADL